MTEPTRAKFCTKCGSPTGESGAFCMHCGAPIATVPQSAPAPDHTVPRSSLSAGMPPTPPVAPPPPSAAPAMPAAPTIPPAPTGPATPAMPAVPAAPAAPAAPAWAAQPPPVAKPADPAAMTSAFGQTFAWPVPAQSVEVAGRRISLEIVVVAALYAVAALWLLIQTWDVIAAIPDIIGGLGGSGLAFAFGWLGLVVALMVLYAIFALGFTAFTLFRVDPVGRGLAAVIAGVFVLAWLTIDARPGGLTLIVLVTVVAAAVLFLSPWAKAAFAESERRAQRPAPIVLAQTLLIAMFSLMALIALMLLPSLGSVSELNSFSSFSGSTGAGTKLVLMELFLIAQAVFTFIAYRQIGARQNRGRIIATVICGLLLLGVLIGISGQSGSLAGLPWIVGILVPLWWGPVPAAWFGRPQVGGPGSGSPHGPTAPPTTAPPTAAPPTP